MSSPSHMLLKDRKAYALLAAYFETIRDVGELTGPAERGLKALGEGVQAIATDVFENDAAPSLDEFVMDAIERAEQSATALAGADATTAIATIIAALRTRAGKIKCATCQAGLICCGVRTDDDAIVAAEGGGECIREIKDALRLAKDIAKREYPDLPTVTIELATDGLTDSPGLIPGISLAANGRTQYRDGAVEKVSHITIEIASRLVDPVTLASLPYLLLHEVFCHAYEMARNSTPRPNQKHIVDPISEGMMDAIAAEILQQRAKAAVGKPECKHFDDEAEAASRIHLARKSRTARPRFPQAPAVSMGAYALDLIQALYRDGGIGDQEQAENDARRLACHLNLHPWAFLDRFEGISRLNAAFASPRDDTLMKLLLDYRTSGDPDEIIKHLTKI